VTPAGVFDPRSRTPVSAHGGDAGGDVLCVLGGRPTGLDALAGSLGVAGRSAEDVLAAAYRRFGESVLERLGGEYAVLLWDRPARRGLLARDRLGACPLFLRSEGGRLYFAAEVRDLLALLPSRPVPDATAVVHWLVGASPRGARTLYDGVRTLEPGVCIRLRGDGWEELRTWEPRYEGTLDLPRDELVDLVRAEVCGAVRRGREAAGADGILVSGGLDSAAVAGLAVADPRAPRAPAGAYSAVFPRHPTTDESPLIDALTQALGLRSVRIAVLGGSMVAGALEYLRQWQLPLMDHNNLFMQPLLRRAAADGVSVMLDGEGGDEVFGAARGLIADHVRRGRLDEAVALTARLPGAGHRPPLRPLVRLLLVHGVRGALPAGLHQGLRRARGPQRFAPSWFTPASARLLFAGDGAWGWKRLRGPRWWAQLAHALTIGVAARGVHDHARRRAQMAGLEARHPLLDPQLIDAVLRLPPALSFDPHRSRPLLRAALAGLVPEEVRLRPGKSYFDAPFQDAMAGADLGAVRRVLVDPGAELGAYVDLEAVRRDLLDVAPSAHPLGARYWAASAWRMVTAECWLRFQGDPDFAERSLESWSLAPSRYELTEDRAKASLRNPT
jgi:asparagine synthase (glutamine-hydrolysing)